MAANQEDLSSPDVFRRAVRRMRKLRSREDLQRIKNELCQCEELLQQRLPHLATQAETGRAIRLQDFLFRARHALEQITPALAASEAGVVGVRSLGDALVGAYFTLNPPADCENTEFLDDAYLSLGGCLVALQIAQWSEKTGEMVGRKGWNSNLGARLEADLASGLATASIRATAKEYGLSDRQVSRLRNKVKENAKRRR